VPSRARERGSLEKTRVSDISTWHHSYDNPKQRYDVINRSQRERLIQTRFLETKRKKKKKKKKKDRKKAP